MSSSLNAISRPLVLEPAPRVARSRSRTVANGDSITLVVRRCFQCSAGKSKKVTSRSQLAVSDSTALGYLAGYSASKRDRAASHSARPSAYIISCSARLARGCKRWGSLSSTLASLWHQQACSRLSGHGSVRVAPHRQRRLLDQPDDLQLLGGRVPHISASPFPSTLFLSTRFSIISSASSSLSW